MKKRNIFFVTIFLVFLVIIYIFRYISINISPLIMKYSIGEMKRVATTIINRSVTDETFDDIEIDDLFIINRNSNEEVVTVTLDNRMINIITNRISDKCEDNLRMIEEGKFAEIKKMFNIGEDYFLVPSGVFIHNSLISNIGPKIPINLKMIGSVNSELLTDVKEYGINNSLITISLEIKMELMVILPINSEIITVSNTIPIAIKIIQGKVPNIYGGSLVK